MSNSDNYQQESSLDADIHQPQQQASNTMDRFKGKWKQQVGAAKIAWGTLTEDELLQTEGRLEKLAGLIQERYAVTSAEAGDQIEKFIQKCGL